jgi:molybdate transport system substrate-binding protein
LQWVAEASAGIGVVYATDAARNRRVKIIYEFPSELFTEPVAYWGVVLNKKPAAEAFMQFIKSAPAAEAAGRYGFKKPDTAHRAD